MSGVLYASATPTVTTSWVKETSASGVSCPTASFCVTASNRFALTSTDPLDPTSWTKVMLPIRANAVSCPSTSFCEVGGITVSVGAPDDVGFVGIADPQDAAPVLQSTTVAFPERVSSVSCASAALCVAGTVDGTVDVTSDPEATGQTWTSTKVLQGTASVTTSCTGAGRCLATGEDGVVVTDDAPSVTWTSVSPSNDVAPSITATGASCVTGGCLWLDDEGRAHQSVDPAHDPASSELVLGNSLFTSVGCASATLCFAGDDGGRILRSTNPAADSWVAQPVSAGPVQGGRVRQLHGLRGGDAEQHERRLGRRAADVARPDGS